jgi:hypothetical protein
VALAAFSGYFFSDAVVVLSRDLQNLGGSAMLELKANQAPYVTVTGSRPGEMSQYMYLLEAPYRVPDVLGYDAGGMSAGADLGKIGEVGGIGHDLLLVYFLLLT